MWKEIRNTLTIIAIVTILLKLIGVLTIGWIPWVLFPAGLVLFMTCSIPDQTAKKDLPL